MRILFITRKFPPAKGGMEQVAWQLFRHLAKTTDVQLVKTRGPNSLQPLLLVILFFKTIPFFKSTELIYLQDGTLAPLGYLLKKILRKPVVITIHGLELTYPNRLYQAVVPWFLSRLDRLVCVSRSSRTVAIRHGLPSRQLIVIPNGISDNLYQNRSRPSHSGPALLTVGRLVERKGVHWFIDQVLPTIVERYPQVRYLVVGAGPAHELIARAIHRRQLEHHVQLLGKISDKDLRSIYSTADIFVMPNIAVPGDLEGFGLVALEAASCALPVVAAKLEGIQDAIIAGSNGLLVESGNAKAYIRELDKLLQNPRERQRLGRQARAYTIKNYSWSKVSNRYLELFNQLCQS